MSATTMSAKIHKWLALVMAVPILFWFGSGLFFALAPIETVRSEHRMANAPAVPVRLDEAAAGLQRLAAAGVPPADKVELRSLLGRPVAVLTTGKARPHLFDLRSGRHLSPISGSMAAAVAERDLAGPERAKRVGKVTKKSTEYRGALPAWRVDFEDGAGRSIYVAADTGLVTSRRSTLWRVFDFLWALHILDFEEHEDFNTPLLAGATILALVVLVTGIVMFPNRLGWDAWRRRRRVIRTRS